jgi:hypothetical protein
MESHDARPGIRVKVSRDYRKPELRGMAGMILQSYGDPGYAALDVRLEDGRTELFWHHQLEKAERLNFGSRPRNLFDRGR